MQKLKIYTKTGDTGTTSLFGGKRVGKNNIRVDTYGNIDELNAHIGLCIAFAQEKQKQYTKPINILALLTEIQNKLFCIGSLIASEATESLKIQEKTIAITESDITFLEKNIDILDATLPEIQSFILPTGSIFASHIHIARTITRRCERSLVTLEQTEQTPKNVIKYINRLSDFFFTLARYSNMIEGIDDIPWQY